MTVIAKNVGRGDFLFHRGSCEQVGVQWKEDKRDGRGFVPVDLTKWKIELELSHASFGNPEVVYRLQGSGYSFGAAVASIPADAFTGDSFKSYSNGEWRIFGTSPQGQKELLGWGHYQIV